MTLLTRSSFARGWMPDADAGNGPIDGLLRQDNLTLDERGVVALRGGSATVHGSPLADLDVHSLFTALLSGVRYRMAGAGSHVYANQNNIATMAGTGDVAFGSHLGQILFARGSTTKKYDGTVRNWGIAAPAGTPTAAGVASDGKVFATCDLAEVPAFTVEEDNGLGPTFGTGVDTSGTGSILLTANATTHRGSLTKDFGAPTDFTTYDAGRAGTDDDLVSFYIYIREPTALLSLRIMVDINDGTFNQDYYFHDFASADRGVVAPSSTSPLPLSTAAQGVTRRRVQGNLPAVGTAVPIGTANLRNDFPVGNSGWSHLLLRRGDLSRSGATTGKDWSTVRALRFVVTMSELQTIAFDDVRLLANPMVGRYKWCAVLANNNGSYVGLSGPGTTSAEVQLQAQGATVTIPADGARDTQANECWLYRMGGVLDGFYRVAVKTGVSGVGAFSIDDALADVDALVLNLKLQTDNGPPPANIIGIAGPYYDRTAALTSDGYLYPSRRLNPDSFASGQVIRVTGVDEQAYWLRKALGGLYIGTSKDIYRLEGTGAELPDGTIDFTLAPTNIDHPPISEAVAQDGNVLLYLANDGWRSVAGAGSVSVVGATSLLYRGQTRHGVGPVNLTGGRFRGAIAHGQLIAVTPEDASTTSSAVLYRHAPLVGAWYRHVYTRAWRCVYREPDGTLLASDTAGFTWQLDTGTTDAGATIPITLWTVNDNDGVPFARKDPLDVRVHVDTGGTSLSAAWHVDSAASPVVTQAVATSGVGIVAASFAAVPAFRQLQLRLTGACSVLRFVAFGLDYVGLPSPIRGQLPPSNAGDPRVKTLSGLQIRLCTIGATRTITPFFDGVAQPSLAVTTPFDEPRDVTYTCATASSAVEIALAFDGDVELYGWTPLTTTRRPLGVLRYDTGPIDLGDKELVWVRHFFVKARATSVLTIDAYLDGRLLQTAHSGAVLPDIDTIVLVDFGRGVKGRQPRLVLRSATPFYPYWVKVTRRVTGLGGDVPTTTVPLPLEGREIVSL